MNTKTKAFTIIVASVVACMLIYAPLTQATQSSISLGDELTVAEMEECNANCFRFGAKARFVWWFLKNSEPVQVDGTVVALTEKKLILNTAEDQIRVNLPAEWAIENEVLTREELFTSGYVSEGESLTVKALGADVTNKEGLLIYVLAGYELINESGIHAIANIAINIED